MTSAASKTGNGRINVTVSHFLFTIVAFDNQ